MGSATRHGLDARTLPTATFWARYTLQLATCKLQVTSCYSLEGHLAAAHLARPDVRADQRPARAADARANQVVVRDLERLRLVSLRLKLVSLHLRLVSLPLRLAQVFVRDLERLRALCDVDREHLYT